MFVDVIFLIPTIFTFSIILVLIVILCFIVIYISHKVYISIYDNLPLGHDAAAAQHSTGNNLLVRSDRQLASSSQTSLNSIWISSRSQIFTSKAVLITISLESCYLASIEVNCMAIASKLKIRSNVANDSCTCMRSNPVLTPIKIIKYYDQLSKIPKRKKRVKDSSASDSTVTTNVRLMLDSIVGLAAQSAAQNR